MTLTNAERQARHRARMKERLAAVPTVTPLRNEQEVREQMAEAILARLSRAYYGQSQTFRKRINGDHIDEYVDGAVEEFMAEQFSFDDIIKMVELAAYTRLVEFFELHCHRSDLDAGQPEWDRHADAMKAAGVT